MLDGEDLFHALEAEAAFAIEEVGNMRLFKSSLLGQMESGEFACFRFAAEGFCGGYLAEL